MTVDYAGGLERTDGGHRPPLQEASGKFLPPEEKLRAGLESLFRWVALVMDELIRFPKTRFKFGLDPLIGLVPGIGDTASAGRVRVHAGRRRATQLDWLFVITVLAILIGIVGAGIAVSLLMLSLIAHALGLD